MCETIYIKKNKSSRFGVHFYNDSTEWNVFLESCGVNVDKLAVIYNKNIENETWKAFAEAKNNKAVLPISAEDANKSASVRNFLEQYKENYTFVILEEPFIMETIRGIVTSDDYKLSYILVPVTPFAQFDSVSIRPKTDLVGDIITKEIFPLGIYVDISVILNAKTQYFLGGIACAFRLAVSYKASMFEWMISNLYELLDCEAEAVCELLSRGYNVHKERIEKDTAKERSLPVYGRDFYTLFSQMESESSEADLLALSMVCQSYLSWKSELLSMEEYYEIRDMFVAFGLAITETFATDEELMDALERAKSDLIAGKEGVYIRKLGKMVIMNAPSKELIKEAFGQIYYNEYENE